MSKSAVPLLNHVPLTAVAERSLSQTSLEKTIPHVPERKTRLAHLLLFTKCWHRGLKELVFCKVNVFLWVPSQQQFADVWAIQRKYVPNAEPMKKGMSKKVILGRALTVIYDFSLPTHCVTIPNFRAVFWLPEILHWLC